MTGQLRIDVYAADGTDFVRSLRLTPAQCEIVAAWIKADLDRLTAPAEPFEVASLDGEELWLLPDAELETLLQSSWGAVIYSKLCLGVTMIDYMLEARFGEELVVDVSARVLDQQGLDGNVYRDLSRKERLEFQARQYADETIPREH